MSQRLQGKLARLLKEGLKEGKADLETLPNGHVCGHVISSEFNRLDYQERRRRIRRVLDRAVSEGKLKASDLLRVSTLLTYTPAEWFVATADTERATSRKTQGARQYGSEEDCI